MRFPDPIEEFLNSRAPARRFSIGRFFEAVQTENSTLMLCYEIFELPPRC
jgi:hypothetical protein